MLDTTSPSDFPSPAESPAFGGLMYPYFVESTPSASSFPSPGTYGQAQIQSPPSYHDINSVLRKHSQDFGKPATGEGIGIGETDGILYGMPQNAYRPFDCNSGGGTVNFADSLRQYQAAALSKSLSEQSASNAYHQVAPSGFNPSFQTMHSFGGSNMYLQPHSAGSVSSSDSSNARSHPSSFDTMSLDRQSGASTEWTNTTSESGSSGSRQKASFPTQQSNNYNSNYFYQATLQFSPNLWDASDITDVISDISQPHLAEQTRKGTSPLRAYSDPQTQASASAVAKSVYSASLPQFPLTLPNGPKKYGRSMSHGRPLDSSSNNKSFTSSFLGNVGEAQNPEAFNYSAFVANNNSNTFQESGVSASMTEHNPGAHSGMQIEAKKPIRGRKRSFDHSRRASESNANLTINTTFNPSVYESPLRTAPSQSSLSGFSDSQSIVESPSSSASDAESASESIHTDQDFHPKNYKQTHNRTNSISAASVKSNASVQDSLTVSEGGKRMYECKTCSRKFPRPSALIVHERIHSGEKPFVCEHCDRPFTVASNLRRHQKIHAKEIKQQTEEASRAEPNSSSATIKPKPNRQKLSHTDAAVGRPTRATLAQQYRQQDDAHMSDDGSDSEASTHEGPPSNSSYSSSISSMDGSIPRRLANVDMSSISHWNQSL